MFHKGLLLSWQTKAGAFTVLTAEDSVFSYGSDDDITLSGHIECLAEIDFFTTVNLTVLQVDEVFYTVVATIFNDGLYAFRPVAASTVTEREAFWFTFLQSFAERDDMGMLTVFGLYLPEVAHAGIGIVACHGPHLIGVWTCEGNVLGLVQRQHTVVLEQYHRLCGQFVGCLSLFGCVEGYMFRRAEVGILIEESYAGFIGKYTFHGFLEICLADQSLIDGFLQVRIRCSLREIHVVTCIYSCCCPLHITVESRYLFDGGIVAHHHAVKAEVSTENAIDNLFVANAVGAMDGMITRHHHLAATFADHRLVGQENLFHEFLLFSIASASIAQEMLAASAYALAETAKL